MQRRRLGRSSADEAPAAPDADGRDEPSNDVIERYDRPDQRLGADEEADDEVDSNELAAASRAATSWPSRLSPPGPRRPHSEPQKLEQPDGGPPGSRLADRQLKRSTRLHPPTNSEQWQQQQQRPPSSPPAPASSLARAGPSLQNRTRTIPANSSEIRDPSLPATTSTTLGAIERPLAIHSHRNAPAPRASANQTQVSGGLQPDKQQWFGASALLLVALLVGLVALWRCLSSRRRAKLCLADDWPAAVSLLLLSPSKRKSRQGRAKRGVDGDDHNQQIELEAKAADKYHSGAGQARLVDRRRPRSAAAQQTSECDSNDEANSSDRPACVRLGESQGGSDGARATRIADECGALDGPEPTRTKSTMVVKRRSADRTFVVAAESSNLSGASKRSANSKLRHKMHSSRKFIDDEALQLKEKQRASGYRAGHVDPGNKLRTLLSDWTEVVKKTLFAGDQQPDVEAEAAIESRAELDGDSSKGCDSHVGHTAHPPQARESSTNCEESANRASITREARVECEGFPDRRATSSVPYQFTTMATGQSVAATTSLAAGRSHCAGNKELSMCSSNSPCSVLAPSPMVGRGACNHNNGTAYPLAATVAPCGCPIEHNSADPMQQPVGGHRSACHLEALASPNSAPLTGGSCLRQCCSVSPSTMLNGHRSALNQLVAAKSADCGNCLAQAQIHANGHNQSCLLASAAGGNRFAISRAKRPYENYYDDEQEDAYRQLTASIGIQFGLNFAQHHHFLGAANAPAALLTHHHQGAFCHHNRAMVCNQLLQTNSLAPACQPETSCDHCAPPAVPGHQFLPLVERSAQVCQQADCTACLQHHQQAAKPNMSILVQQPSVCTPPPAAGAMVAAAALAGTEPQQLDSGRKYSNDSVLSPNLLDERNSWHSDANRHSAGHLSISDIETTGTASNTSQSADLLNESAGSSCNLLMNSSDNSVGRRRDVSPLLGGGGGGTRRDDESAANSRIKPYSSASPLLTSPTPGGHQRCKTGELRKSPRWVQTRRFSQRALGQLADETSGQSPGQAPLPTVYMGAGRPQARRMSIAGDQVRKSAAPHERHGSLTHQKSELAGQAQCQARRQPRFQHRASIASDGSANWWSTSVERNRAGGQHSGPASNQFDATLALQSGRRVCKFADSSGACFCSNYSSSAGSSSGIGFSGSQCTNTPTTSVCPFGSFASSQVPAAGEQTRARQHPQQVDVCRRTSPCDANTQLAMCQGSLVGRGQQLHQRQHPSQYLNHQVGRQQHQLAYSNHYNWQPRAPFEASADSVCQNRKFSLPVQLESSAAELTNSASKSNLLFEKNFERADCDLSANLAANEHTAQLDRFDALPDASAPSCSVDEQTSRRSSQTITRQSSFWLEEGGSTSTDWPGGDHRRTTSVDARPSDSVCEPRGPFGETSSSSQQQQPTAHASRQPQLDEVVARPAGVSAKVDELDSPAKTSNQQARANSSPSSSSLSPISPLDRKANQSRAPGGQARLAAKSRLSSSSTSSAASSPSPDFGRPSQRLLALASKSSSITKRRLFGRLRTRRFSRQGSPGGPGAAQTLAKGLKGQGESRAEAEGEFEDEFTSSVERDFKNAPGARPMSDLNSASLERQCRDLWKLRATLHDDSCAEDDWANYHQRLNRRHDSGYRSIENQFSSSVEGGAPANSPNGSHQAEQPTARRAPRPDELSRPPSGCSGSLARARTTAPADQSPDNQGGPAGALEAGAAGEPNSADDDSTSSTIDCDIKLAKD